MKLPVYVSTVIEKLNNRGFEAYAVGGCVRDSLLGIEPNDYDITTNASPEEIKETLSDFRTVDTGIEFGTVTVISDGNPIEITTYRIDGDYKDNRRPDNVRFTSELSEDLRRRDFTINAMAFDNNNGIIDFFGGSDDLSNGIIRAIGNPYERFNEDGLRIMRALRFASCYGFFIENETSDAIHKCSYLLKNIAKERIAVEFNKLICSNCGSILREYNDVFSVIIPEIKNCVGFEQHTKYHNKDVFEHIISTVEVISPEKHLRLAMLFHDIGKPQYFTMDEKGQGHFKNHAKGSFIIAEKFLSDYHYDNQTADRVLKLIETHDIIIENREKLIKRYLNKFGVDILNDIISVHIADDKGKSLEFQSRIKEYNDCYNTINKIIGENQCFSLNKLEIKGNDIIDLGFKGKSVGLILNKLLDMVIEEKIVNSKDALIAMAEKIGGDII